MDTDNKPVVEDPKKPVVEEDSDFADEAKPIEAPVEAKAIEAKTEETKIDLHAEEATSKESVPLKEPLTYVYDDEKLKGIEAARQSFFQSYKKSNVVKWIVTAGVLAFIIAGWLIPTFTLTDETQTSLSFGITIGVVAVALVALGVYSYFYKKKMDVAMKAYFAKYYELNNEYVYGDRVEAIKGAVDDKLDPEVFKAAGLFKDVAKVGSRETIHFNYKGKDCLLSDCAGQIKGAKALQTVFVGKLLVVPNAYAGPDVIIYLKGNKRALPPTTLDDYDVIEDSKTMVVYGQSLGKKILTKPVRVALAKIRTNDTLVDLAVSIKKGTTYFALGYDDNLMILPLEKPFNPAPTEELKADTDLVLDLADAFEAHPEDK
jgi:hypothetical protein